MKIILVRPSYKSHIITPPLGLGYLAAYLKRHNIDVIIIDNLKEKLNRGALVKKIICENPDAVGITCLTAFYYETVNLSQLLKDNNIRCIIGGVHPTFLPYQTLLDSHADYVICGEGEIPFLRLIENNFINEGIPGVYSKQNLKSGDEEIKRACIIENLDDLPFPDWEQINPRYYPAAPHGAVAKNFPIGVILTSRGCPFECTFCASPGLYGRKIRLRSAENVIQEIQYLVQNFDVREIHFEDDNLTLNRDHIVNICKLILKNDIKISWACPNGIRADCVDEELIKLMKESGCYYFAIGIESGDPLILDNVRKRESLRLIRRSIQLADKYAIQCQGFFIFGLPGETAESIKKTISFSKEAPLTRAQFLILDVLPGSELWHSLSGQFRPNWSKNSFKEPEWIPLGLTREQLINAQRKAFFSFYLRPRIVFKLARYVRPKQIRFIFQRLKEYRIWM